MDILKVSKFCSQLSGVWFQSSVSGLFYENHLAAGDIQCVVVNGQRFYRKTDTKTNQPSQ